MGSCPEWRFFFWWGAWPSGELSSGELSWWGLGLVVTYLVGSCPGGELSRMGNRTGGELSRVEICSGGGLGLVVSYELSWWGLGLVVTYLVESCPGRELSRVGNRPGGELSCWGILVGTHLRGSCSVGRYPRTFKAPS